MNNWKQVKPTVHDRLQEMADAAQNAGMNPDEVNRVCASFEELLAVCKMLEGKAEYSIFSMAEADALREAIENAN